MINYLTNPQTSPLAGQLVIPGDKSISHRALLLSALAEGETTIEGLSDAIDVANTRYALEQMGISIYTNSPLPQAGEGLNQIKVTGQGLYGLKQPQVPLDLGNSGTAMRLLAGILVNQSFASQLIGDNSLSQRPMRRIVDPLRQFGAQITATEQGTPPLSINPGQISTINYTLPIASAQIKSALMLAALYAPEVSRITENTPTRDHTERLFQHFSIPCTRQENVITVTPTSFSAVSSLTIPGDISSAAFFIAAATLLPGSDIVLKNCGINPLRMGFISVLKKMGADIEVTPYKMAHNELMADIRVRHAPLYGITVPSTEVVAMIDEFPIFFVVAACSKGTTEVRGVEELRHKESDRLGVMAGILQSLGITVTEFSDGLTIIGGSLTGGVVASQGDHRIAMATVVAGLRAQDTLFITDCDNVATSFPRFVAMAQQVGMHISIKES